MTVPSEYTRASIEFERFMVKARDEAGLATTNMAWNMVVGVLETFRRRLTVEEGLRFAGVLPPVLRAIFVTGWNPPVQPVPFASRGEMTAELRSLRREHNFSPDTSIAAVATSLHSCVDVSAFTKVLATLPPGAREFWSVE